MSRGRSLLVALPVTVAMVAVAVVIAVRAGHEDGVDPVAAVGAVASESRHREGATPPRQVLSVPVCAAGSVVRLDTGRVTYAVTVLRHATAFRAPAKGPFAGFDRLNVNGVPTVFAVVGAKLDNRCKASWYRVQLPMKPNGVTGWVSAASVSERKLHVRIVVDLSERRVTVLDGARTVLVTTAAIGSPSTPTPTGRYFVNQKLVPSDPLGPFGPGALGISAFSPVLQSWAQGGPIAIHGTNQAQLLGSAVSHGCVRVANNVVERLWKLVPTGTPVLIRM
jgi:lipoprotein-anchoring transpeptidase ErfK/SrfK